MPPTAPGGFPAGALAQPGPSPGTPRKQQLSRERLNAVFTELSASYKLDLTLPDPTRSPTKRQRSSDRSEQIYWRLFYQQSQGCLRVVLDRFREKAVKLSTRWVDKPQSQDLVTPMITGLPQATTARERDDLIELLQGVLRDFAPPRPPQCSQREAFALFAAGPHLTGVGTTAVGGETAIASAWPTSSEEKSTSPDLEVAPQNIFVVGRSTPSAKKNPRTASRLSAHSSKASCVAPDDPVFSHAVDTPFPTATTVEASSQEKQRLPPPASSLSYSYNPSSSALLALNESFAAFEEPGYPKLPSFPESGSSDLSDAESSSFPSAALEPLMKQVSQSTAEPAKSPAELLEESLDSVWLQTPRGLGDAPLAITWEVLRVCSALGLDPGSLSFTYSKEWLNQNTFWRALATHPQLQEHRLPEPCHPDAWAIAVGSRAGTPDQVLTLAASLVFTPKKWPLFKLRLKPLRLDLPHRLDRRFGSDRFLELIIPALDSIRNEPSLKALEAEASLVVKKWLIKKLHKFLGRTWAAFFVRELREKAPKKAAKPGTSAFEPPLEAPGKNRLHLFAQDGSGFLSHSNQAAQATDGPRRHIKMDRAEMAEWLLQVSKNQDQAIMKLCSRFALGLSRTQPTIVLQKREIRSKKHDKISEFDKQKIMNDGIGRVSISLARKIRDHLGLPEVPTGFQGRIGSGKGFWIRDTEDKRPGDWIEIYPSQRKWKCDFLDPEHRTVEVLHTAMPLKPADTNPQFLDVLEDRAKDKEKMRDIIGGLLRKSLEKAIEEQRAAMEDPKLLRLWVQENMGNSHPGGLVSYLGGLPRRDGDQMNILLHAGFDPKRLQLLSDLSLKLQREKCEEIKQRMNIRIGSSTYAFMVVDFLGILEENEIHLGFSSSFKDEQTGFCETFLHDMDVLVARAPAHFPSDIQRVKAVFKPEYGSLKDVIIFPIKGKVALADKLSGGDYDGDKAWVCWNQEIVSNFENAAVPEGPDLVKEGFLSNQTKTYRDLVQEYGSDQASLEFFERSLLFNMEPALLGKCTNFKESFCYERGSIGDEAAIRLSTLLSKLVDQSKQGMKFTHDDWTRFYKPLLGGRPVPPQPGYKFDSFARGKPFKHILDHLKFGVLLPVIDRELAQLHKVDDKTQQPVHWDPDLARLANTWDEISKKRPRAAPVLGGLDASLDQLYGQWQVPTDETFEAKVTALCSTFRSIQPSKPTSTVGDILLRGGLQDDYSTWSLLKASVLFKRFYKRGTFVWWIAGRQLCMLKRCMQNSEESMRGNDDRLPMVICPEMYAALRADAKYIRSMALKGGICFPGVAEEAQEPRDDDDNNS